MTQARRTPAKRTAKPKTRPASTPDTGRERSAAPKPAAQSLKIVARLHGYPPSHNAGAEWMAHAMLRALVARGHDVSVWLSRYSAVREPYRLDGVQVVPLAARMDFAAASKSADVLLSHLENVPPTGALARGFGKPLVVVCHNTFPATFRNMATGQAALAVYNSRWMAAEAEVYYTEFAGWVRPARSTVVPPPVFAAEYAATPGDAVTLVNLNADKGGELFWQLAARLSERRFLGVRGSYGNQVVKSLPNVEVLDHQPGPDMAAKVYAKTRVLLMPSAYESYGRVGIEAMCSGIPVVAHPTPGLCESLGEAGIFVERNDFDGWVAVLEKLTEPEEWRVASKRALARAAELDPAGDLATWCDTVESLCPA